MSPIRAVTSAEAEVKVRTFSPAPLLKFRISSYTQLGWKFQEMYYDVTMAVPGCTFVRNDGQTRGCFPLA